MSSKQMLKSFSFNIIDPSNLQDHQRKWRVGGVKNQIFCDIFFNTGKGIIFTGSNIMDCDIAKVEEQLKSNQKAEARKLLV